jgi:hypothetical protein
MEVNDNEMNNYVRSKMEIRDIGGGGNECFGEDA